MTMQQFSELMALQLEYDNLPNGPVMTVLLYARWRPYYNVSAVLIWVLGCAVAALAVGWWAAAHTGSRRWAAPLLFVALLGVGLAIGLRFGVLPGLEAGLAVSVIALGALVVAYRRFAAGAALAIIGTFALLHGVAHGGEAPAGVLSAVTGYGAGLLLGTAALHCFGFAGGAALRRMAPALWRAAGLGVACVGMLLLAH